MMPTGDRTEKMLRPPMPPPLPAVVPIPPMTADGVGRAGTDDMVFESTRRGVKLRLTEHTLSRGRSTIRANDITDIAFWMPKTGLHRVHVESSGSAVAFGLAGRGGGAAAAAARIDYTQVVEWLEQRVIPRLVQSRLSRIGLGLTVRIGRMELREAGIRRRGFARSRDLRWSKFDHIVVTRKHIVVISRGSRGRLHQFARLPLNELNAVLLPILLPAASNSYR